MNSENKKTILLVEDEIMVAASEKKALEKYGYNVLIASSGEEAISLSKNNNTINLILMDIDLGKGLDGTQTAEIILKENQIPIVFLSSHTEPEIVEKTEKITSYGYVVKNSSITVLDASIKMAFKLFSAMRETKEKEDALEKSKETAEKYLNVAAEIILSLDTSGNIVLLNDSGHRLLEWEAGELIGKNWFDTCLQKENLQEVKNVFSMIIAGNLEPVIAYENNVITKNGVIKTILWHNSILYDSKGRITGILSSGEDITERKRAEEKLQTNEYLLRYILDTIPQTVFWKDINSVYLGCNKAFAKTARIENPDDIVGKTDFDLPWTKSDAEAYRADDMFVTGNNSSKYHIIEEVQNHDGTRIIVDTTKLPLLNNKGSVYGVLGVYEDITERKLAEDTIKRQLTEKNILLKEVHHRIKNNIASVESLLSLQLQSVSNTEAVSVLQDAISRIKIMRILYDRLLIKDDYKIISVKAYIGSLIDAVFALFPNNVHINYEKKIDEFLLSSKNLFPLGIILNELLTNVLKYAFKDREAGFVNISLTKIENQVRLTIQDNGRGLHDNFDISKSNGFGLILVDMMIKQLGGTFTIENEDGTRCILTFSI